jgi:hypothetical protein
MQIPKSNMCIFADPAADIASIPLDKYEKYHFISFMIMPLQCLMGNYIYIVSTFQALCSFLLLEY